MKASLKQERHSGEGRNPLSLVQDQPGFRIADARRPE
jgi:hypothetical protein